MSRSTQHRHVPAGRTQHLIDLENLTGGPFPSRNEALQTVDAYLEAAEWCPGDLTVLAANRWLYKQVAFDLPSHIRALPVIGRDGADLALLGWTSAEDVHARFDRLVIGSGDNIFTDLVVNTTRLGTPAWVVAVDGSLSKRLAGAATHRSMLTCTTAQAA